MKKLPIHEYFYTWQGEGTHAGKAAFFIRTMGCPVHCPWCDSAGTWHPDHMPKSIDRLTVEELVTAARTTPCEFAVISGGEPTIHDLTELTQSLRQAGIPSHLETCGAFPIQGLFDWITLSPKWAKLPNTENLARANEIKLIIENIESIPKWLETLEGQLKANIPIWLQPEWSMRHNPAVLNTISQHVKQFGAPFRAGIQMHKYYNVDALDVRSRDLPELIDHHPADSGI